MTQINKIKEEFDKWEKWDTENEFPNFPSSDEIADWWLNKIKELIFQHNELLIKKIEEEYDKDEYCYQTCVVDIINLIKNSK